MSEYLLQQKFADETLDEALARTAVFGAEVKDIPGSAAAEDFEVKDKVG